jgi:DUF1680 family protein
MGEPLARRNFLVGMALATAAVPAGSRLVCAHPVPPSVDGGSEPVVSPFALQHVRLRESPWLAALETNRAYMLGLDPDRLLHMFRVTAGIPSAAQPYGGWEAAVNELRGHFVGHYLSACALMLAQTGNEAVGKRGTQMVAELGKCQHANGDGYLSAFPREFFDRLRDGKRVWAPFYTYHKIMAGLYDSYTLMGNQQALSMLKGMADWTRAWAEPLSDTQLQKILNVEHGGMTEVLYNLGAATGDTRYIDLGHRFDHERILGPLAAGRDELTNVHGNTNVPKIIGAALRYEVVGEPRSRDIARYFWQEIAQRRSYVTGGSTSGEAWRGEPGHLAHTLSGYTQETCVTYNMLKLTRHLFTWSPEPSFADYYERAFFNGILPTQHPANGEKIYYTPLASGYWKLFGTPGEGFWCCHGSGVENFAKVGDSIYFHDKDGIFVNLFVASEVSWPEKRLRLIQETKFPESDTMTFIVRAARPVKMALRIRVPYWATGSNFVKLNGRIIAPPMMPSSYFVSDRVWRDGDRLELRLPMSLHTAATPDDPSVQAIMYGPLVLVGRMGTEGINNDNRRAEPTKPRTVPEYKDPNPPKAPELRASSENVSQWIKAVAGKPLEFRTTGQTTDFTLVPLYRLFDERYAVYWKVNRV